VHTKGKNSISRVKFVLFQSAAKSRDLDLDLEFQRSRFFALARSSTPTRWR